MLTAEAAIRALEVKGYKADVTAGKLQENMEH